MPTVVTDQPYRPVPLEPPRKRWTRQECTALEASGLWNQERLELIEGELISKMGKKRPHVNTLVFVQEWLIQIFGAKCVNVEAPIDVSPEDNPTNEPEPDLIVLNRPSGEFLTANPQPANLCLVVEISDSTLGFDLTKKAKLYARAGIADYWVVDIAARQIIVHRNPQTGTYRSISAYSEQEVIKPLASDAEFRVGNAFTHS